MAAAAVCTGLPAGAPAEPVPPLDIALSVPGPGGESMPVELAAKIGADRAEGIALRLRFVDGGGVTIRDLLTRNAEFGVFALPSAMHENLSHPLLVALAALDDLPLHTLMVRADLRRQITHVADLDGHVIGVHSDSLATKTTSHRVAELLLRSYHVPLANVRFVAAGQNWETQSSAFISHAVDASMCDEPVGTRLADGKLAYRLYSLGNPQDARRTPGGDFLRGALIARRDLVEARPETAHRMVNVVRRALDWIARHSPEQAADALELREHSARASFLAIAHEYPRQFSHDGRFSDSQLRDTEVFFRADEPDDPRARAYSVDSMIVDRWAGRKP